MPLCRTVKLSETWGPAVRKEADVWVFNMIPQWESQEERIRKNRKEDTAETH